MKPTDSDPVAMVNSLVREGGPPSSDATGSSCCNSKRPVNTPKFPDPRINKEFVRAHFSYDPSTGALLRKIATRFSPVGSVVGCQTGKGHLTGAGYLGVRLKNRLYKVAHLVWLHEKGTWPAQSLDHIDRDTNNNRIENLREATRFQQAQNLVRKKTSRSGVRGVYWHIKMRRWQAEITANGRRLFLGSFKSKAQAVRARRAGEKTYHGEYSPRRKKKPW